MPRLAPLLATVLLVLAPAALPSAQAAPGSCTSSAVPLPVVGVPLTVHVLVNMPVCSASASCTACVGMPVRLEVEGIGLVSGQMLAGGPGGAPLLQCADLNGCVAVGFAPYTSFTFHCEGSGGELGPLDPVPTVALGVKVTCWAG